MLTKFRLILLCLAFCFRRYVTRILRLASGPGRLSPVKAMKAEVCARELGSGPDRSAYRRPLDELPPFFGDMDGSSVQGCYDHEAASASSTAHLASSKQVVFVVRSYTYDRVYFVLDETTYVSRTLHFTSQC
jgi:hypothetical protein